MGYVVSHPKRKNRDAPRMGHPNEKAGNLKTGRSWTMEWLCGMVLAALAGTAWAGEVHSNPLNRDPLVKEAYVHFYDLDYPGAVGRFERFHEEHPGDPQAT